MGDAFTPGGTDLFHARQINAVGNIQGTLGRRPVFHLPLPVALIQCHDTVRGLVALAAQLGEKIHPLLAEIRHFRIVFFHQSAVITDPFTLKQINLPFLGVDTMLGKQQWLACPSFQHGTQKAGIAGGDGVIHARRDQIAGNIIQYPQGGMHDAYGPEIIHKGRVAAVLAIGIGDEIPACPTVQECILGITTAIAKAIQSLAQQSLTLPGMSPCAHQLVEPT